MIAFIQEASGPKFGYIGRSFRGFPPKSIVSAVAVHVDTLNFIGHLT